TGSLTWVAMNDAASRYWLPTFLVALASVTRACWSPLWCILSRALPGKTRRGRMLSLALALAVLSASLCAYGLPSFKTVRGDIDNVCGRLTGDIRTAGCTHIVGNYWKVWPAMF